MTKKAMKKLALRIYQCELIHEDPASSKEDKARAEAKIMQLTNEIMAMKDGLNILSEVDDMIQQLLESKN